MGRKRASVSDDQSSTSKLIKSEEMDCSSSTSDEQKVPSSSPIEGDTPEVNNEESKRIKSEVPSTSSSGLHKMRFKPAVTDELDVSDHFGTSLSLNSPSHLTKSPNLIGGKPGQPTAFAFPSIPANSPGF